MRSPIYKGYCSVCGQWVSFSDVRPSIRETYQCEECRASLRERVTADAIVAVYGNAQQSSIRTLIKDSLKFNSSQIYEVGVSGAYRRYFSKHDDYTNSFYWKDVKKGEEKDGIRCEDLMDLTFDDNSFDLIITSDILEHVRHPWIAFDEIKRVLKPGGYHIFSIPSLVAMPSHTIRRVETSGINDKNLMEPRYHGDGRGGKSLVYTDFGADLFADLEKRGFSTYSIKSDHIDKERIRVNAFISKKNFGA